MIKKPLIAHVDMDCFFAAVEMLANPSLQGKAVGVVGQGKRTVVTTSSYEARALGVKTGMNLYEAKTVCPSLIIVKGDNTKYTYTSRLLNKIFLSFTPQVETYSIDEAFLDFTCSAHLGSPLEIGYKIKQKIKNDLGLCASVGFGPNKLIAKIASSMNKPDGLKHIAPDDVEKVLKNFPVQKIWGIGRQTTKALNSMGVNTCKDLGVFPVSVLRSRFGIFGERLSLMGRGIYSDKVTPDSEVSEQVKTIGHSTTLSKDIHKREDIEKWLFKLSEKVGKRARSYGYKGKKIGLTVRYSDFVTITRQTKLSTYINDSRDIYNFALRILDNQKLQGKIRLLGVTLSSLTKDTGQLSLFNDDAKKDNLNKVMDSVNDRYGKRVISSAHTHQKREDSGVISPAWRPGGVRYVDVR